MHFSRTSTNATHLHESIEHQRQLSCIQLESNLRRCKKDCVLARLSIWWRIIWIYMNIYEYNYMILYDIIWLYSIWWWIPMFFLLLMGNPLECWKTTLGQLEASGAWLSQQSVSMTPPWWGKKRFRYEVCFSMRQFNNQFACFWDESPYQLLSCMVGRWKHLCRHPTKNNIYGLPPPRSIGLGDIKSLYWPGSILPTPTTTRGTGALQIDRTKSLLGSW